MKLLAVVVPAKDEEATIGELLNRIAGVRVPGHELRVIVVDDGSTDRTAQIARAKGAVVISHEENRGLGAAVRTGLWAAVERGAVAVAYLDADLEYHPEDIPRLVEPVLFGRADYMLGSRFAGRDRRVRGMRLYRRVGNLVFSSAHPRPAAQRLRLRRGPHPLPPPGTRRIIRELALPGQGSPRYLA